MDRRVWILAAAVAGLFVAAWIYMDLQKRYWLKTTESLQEAIAETDSLAKPHPKDTPVGREKERVRNVVEELRELSAQQVHRTDSSKKIMEDEGLLDNQQSSRK